MLFRQIQKMNQMKPKSKKQEDKKCLCCLDIKITAQFIWFHWLHKHGKNRGRTWKFHWGRERLFHHLFLSFYGLFYFIPFSYHSPYRRSVNKHHSSLWSAANQSVNLNVWSVLWFITNEIMQQQQHSSPKI